MIREFTDPLIVYVAMMAFCAATMMAWTVRRPYGPIATDRDEAFQLFATTLICTCVAWAGGGNEGGALLAGVVAILCGAGLRILLPRLTLPGALAMATLPLSFLAGVLWTYCYLRDSGAPNWLLVLALGGAAIAAAMLALAFAEGLARQALLTHAVWRRPYRPLSHAGSALPKVSIHLPCYAEPPEVVIATLDRLARLDYPNFEVLVCDNNTTDEALWRPVEAHCQRLNRKGDRFRFFHVAPLPGAKAGALNFLIERMDPDVELIAVIDADYLSTPDFLSRLVGFFEDPQLGFVQTPHDYRAWGESAFLSACYWEYMPNNKVELPGLNEYGAAFTIGTMCVIRAEALERAGGWAEWCLTEDSEVSVRIRALGYDGIYLRDTFGRGLIPETFADYKKQRFRWTAGPVQQLRRHWRYFLPGTLGKPSALEGWSKLLEFQRGMAPILGVVATVFGLASSCIFLAVTEISPTFPSVALPASVWVTFAITIATVLINTWHRYRLSGCKRIADIIRGEIARLSLSYVALLGGVAGLSSRPLAWRRTPKFKAKGAGLRALADTLPETMIGLFHVGLIAAAISLHADLGWSGTLLTITGMAMSGARFFAAPAMAILSERSLAMTARQSKVANVEASSAPRHTLYPQIHARPATASAE